VVRTVLALTLLALAYGTSTWAGEAPGIAVGAAAPALQGKVWFSADGKAPDLAGKVYLVSFWFAG
jgi:hypothetical protein